MRSTLSKVAPLVALASSVVADFAADFARSQESQLEFHPTVIGVARFDSIVSPGVNKTGGHVHTFLGASNASPETSRESLLKANYTTFPIGNKLDMSLYVPLSQANATSLGLQV